MSVPVALFARVSTTRQQTDRQISDLEAVARQRGFDVVASIVETISGTKRRGERPQLEQLMALATSGQIRKVLVTEISRLGRRTVEVLKVLEELTENKVSVYVLNYNMETLLESGKRNPIAGLLFTLLAEFAQMEKELQNDRIKSGLENVKRKGIKLGRKPGSVKSDKEILAQYPKVVKHLNQGKSIREVATLAGVSDKTVQKVKRILAGSQPS